MCRGMGLWLVCVERRPCFICFWWPLAVANALGRCFLTMFEVSPGQEAKYPASMALHHVLIVGLNAAAWRKAISFGMVLVW